MEPLPPVSTPEHASGSSDPDPSIPSLPTPGTPAPTRTKSLPASKLSTMSAEDAFWTMPAGSSPPETPSPSKSVGKKAAPPPPPVSDWTQRAEVSAATAFSNLGLAPAVSKETAPLAFTRFMDGFKKIAPLVDMLLVHDLQNEESRMTTARQLAALRRDIDNLLDSGLSSPPAYELAHASCAAATNEALSSMRVELESTSGQLQNLLASAIADMNTATSRAHTAPTSAADLMLSDNLKFRELWNNVLNLSRQGATATNDALRADVVALSSTVAKQKATMDDMARRLTQQMEDFTSLKKEVTMIRQDNALPPIHTSPAQMQATTGALPWPGVAPPAPAPAFMSAPSPVTPRFMTNSAPPVPAFMATPHMPDHSMAPPPAKRARPNMVTIAMGPLPQGPEVAKDMALRALNASPGFSQNDLDDGSFWWTTRRDGRGRNLGMTFLDEDTATRFMQTLNSGHLSQLNGLTAWRAANSTVNIHDDDSPRTLPEPDPVNRETARPAVADVPTNADSRKISIGYLNVHGFLTTKIQRLGLVKIIEAHDIMVMAETFFAPGEAERTRLPVGFMMITASRPLSSHDRPSGGVALIYRASVPVVVIPIVSEPDILAVDIGPLVLLAVYKWPRKTH
ncbi:hypothetical protein CYLTODRAFT_420044 [Cylindrobasidium torrendii FP15055 ss-10]|uniref:Uncharacterized protein n=1 Tax=Cylindrobasidium torrendii FP15055 ss-10 TaxID=1314674 RepID=A0A0D7BJD5_9AGAR|nr:hypothetical protein CYLTODRAFT_420044 [Cylindrobasidium torrendii FP15055 ss-10]